LSSWRRREHGTTLRREVTLVLDRSGSMAGRKLAQARTDAQQVIAGLADGEGIQILDYGKTKSGITVKALPSISMRLPNGSSSESAISFRSAPRQSCLRTRSCARASACNRCSVTSRTSVSDRPSRRLRRTMDCTTARIFLHLWMSSRESSR
jgi:hypothetical protein